MNILISGGAGYLGGVTALSLIEAGHRVVVLDSLLFGAQGIAALTGHESFKFVQADVLDAGKVTAAMAGIDAVIHLAAIVGDPACARDPQHARKVNVDGSKAIIKAAAQANVRRLLFASTCSNYGRMTDSSVLASEDHELRPVSLYAETKVEVEKHLLSLGSTTLSPTVLRFATLYGIGPRMRFDLTVNEFVMRLMTDKQLKVFGEQFWRPYVHVRDAASAIVRVLAQPTEIVGGRVFNVGSTAENYTKEQLVGLIQNRIGPVQIEYVRKAEDPRDYRVSFELIKRELGFVPKRTVLQGIDEIASAIEAGVLTDFDHWTRSNTSNRVAATTT